ncbi:hypothetical protein FHR81_003182 [Actinoalloteichus hoggarensis]|uniref:Uncharacterized protein n=1 Tax=Actinoalloteichus hoggarensis TaxID=1470176 RepID=A0A221W7J0_9PSEU|nr:hypothetical protein AHOG_19585 [Actinoalloteichus hoggarensis]MBB5922130.1 hypothetical protein [Actinoalloteichus hoggarensis]
MCELCGRGLPVVAAVWGWSACALCAGSVRAEGVQYLAVAV